jgi:hypothetical protein
MMWGVIAIALAVLCCSLCGHIAKRRGRSIRAWVWLGAIFGPVALLLLVLLPAHLREACEGP